MKIKKVNTFIEIPVGIYCTQDKYSHKDFCHFYDLEYSHCWLFNISLKHRQDGTDNENDLTFIKHSDCLKL